MPSANELCAGSDRRELTGLLTDVDRAADLHERLRLMRSAVSALRALGSAPVWRMNTRDSACRALRSGEHVPGKYTIAVAAGDTADIDDLKQWSPLPKAFRQDQTPQGRFELQLFPSPTQPLPAALLAQWWQWIGEIVNATEAAGYRVNVRTNTFEFVRANAPILTFRDVQNSERLARSFGLVPLNHPASSDEPLQVPAEIPRLTASLTALARQPRQLIRAYATDSFTNYHTLLVCDDSGVPLGMADPEIAHTLLGVVCHRSVDLTPDGLVIGGPYSARSAIILSWDDLTQYAWDLPQCPSLEQRSRTGRRLLGRRRH